MSTRKRGIEPILRPGDVMSMRQLGLVVVGDKVTVVDANVPSDPSSPIEIIEDTNWKLQAGDRPAAYAVLAKRCASFIRENGIKRVTLKASATTRGAATLSLLHSAELRGVVIAAAASVIDDIKELSKSHISRHYGNRKVDEYVQDDAFWKEQTSGGTLRKASREAAMIIIAGRS